MPKLAVLVSGSGTILEAMIAGHGLEVGLVVADRPCRGLAIAAQAGIETVLVDRREHQGHLLSLHVAAALYERSVDLVAMAGFMTILDSPVFDFYGGRILNTHPSLLPSFPGAHAVEQTLAAGAKITGCTTHIAIPEVDAGPILAQAAIDVQPGDTEETLSEAIKFVERQMYPQVVRAVLTGRKRSLRVSPPPGRQIVAPMYYAIPPASEDTR